MLAVAACTAGWHQPPELALGSMDEGRQVRVWHGGGVERWHSVVVTEDSLLGVHWRRPRGCDSCRVALPVAAVDSVQIGNPMRVFWRGLGIAGIITVVATAPWWLPT